MGTFPGPDRLGKRQKLIRRAFIANDGQPLTFRELRDWAFPRNHNHPAWHKKSMWLALQRFGRRIGWGLWAPKDGGNGDRGNRLMIM